MPERFEEALLSMRHAPRPRGLVLDEVPAPRRLAPYAAALTAETVQTEGGVPIATGRFVVLHDPAGQDAWNGDLHIIAMTRSRLDDEVGADHQIECSGVARSGNSQRAGCRMGVAPACWAMRFGYSGWPANFYYGSAANSKIGRAHV